MRNRRIFDPNLEGAIYFNAPLDILVGLEDDDLLRAIRRLRLTVRCAQGAWDDKMLEETGELQDVQRHKSIPAQ